MIVFLVNPPENGFYGQPSSHIRIIHAKYEDGKVIFYGKDNQKLYVSNLLNNWWNLSLTQQVFSEFNSTTDTLKKTTELILSLT